MGNNYRFYVEAMTGDAVAKLNEIDKLMDKIDSKSAKGTQNFFHTSQKDIDKAVEEMQKLIKAKKELDRAFDNQKINAESMGDMTAYKRAVSDAEELTRRFNKTQKEFQNHARMQANPNYINASTLRQQKAFRDELTEQERAIRNISRAQQELNRVNSRVNHRANQASATGRMTYNQSESMKRDLRRTGVFESLGSENKSRQQELRERYKQRQEELAETRSNTNLDRQVRKNRETSIQAEIKEIEKEIEARKRLADSIKETVENLKSKEASLNASDIKVDADRKSIRGVLAERAPSISMAMLGGTAAAIGGLYAKGATANAGMRDASISLGQRTGTSDFRALRKSMQEMGIEKQLGYKGADMLQFQEDALSNIGFTSKEDLAGSTRALAEGSRAVPVDNETLSDFMNSQMKSGAISGRDQIKNIQEGFLGAIQRSGMAGREKEQLEALKTLSEQSFTGRNGSNQELKEQMAMLTMLNQTGKRAVQGEQGAQLMSSLSAGIQGSVWNNKASLLLGKGTQFQGLAGMYDLKAMQEQGATPENLQKIIGSVQQSVPGDEKSQKYAFGSALHELFGTDAKNDQIDAIWEAYANGGLSQDNVDRIMNESQSTGKGKYDKNIEDYANSKEGTANRSEAVTEKQASQINDMGDILRETNSKLGALPPALYALGAGLGAMAVSLATPGSIGGLSSLIKKGTRSTFSTGGGVTAGGGFLKSAKEAFSAGKGSGGWFQGIKNVGSVAKDSAMGVGAKAVEGAKGLKGAGMGSKVLGGLGKAGKFLGKVATPLAIGSSLLDIATADDKTKAVGESVGAIGGGIGGAKLGAMIGTFIAPGLGTGIGGAIGGGIGAIGGTLAGSKLGGKFVDGVRKFFGGEEAHAEEADLTAGQDVASGQESKSGVQEARDTANKRVLSEKTRAENNAEESANLSIYSKLLDRAQRILNQAKNQNGIFGNSGSSKDSSDGMGSDASSKDFGGDWEKAIRQASKKMGVDVSDDEIDTILRLIQAESSGDESAVQQIIDENNFNGNGGAKGLLQYVQSTFDAYKVDGHDNIMSGYDQLLAFFNNSNWKNDLNSWDSRYQNGSTGWGPTGNKTRAMGGHITSPEYALLGEVAGQDEYVINPSQPTAPRLLAEATRKTAQNFRLTGNGSGHDWGASISKINATGGAQSGSAPTMTNTNEVSVNVTIQGGGTSDSIAREIGDKSAGIISKTLDATFTDFFAKEYRRV